MSNSILDLIKSNPLAKKAAIGVGALALGMIGYNVVFDGILYYNDAGYQAHIRTKFPFNDEKVVNEIGYTTKWFGTATAWPREMTVQSVSSSAALPKNTSSEDVDGQGSALISAFPITFLGGVTGTVDSNIRIILPQGDQFMQLARSYRNPNNFILQAVTPAMKNTLQSTAQMMSADDYYGGSRSAFAQAFSDQMSEGIYLVDRQEVQVENTRKAAGGSVAQDGSDQGEFGGNTSTVVKTVKVLDKKGQPVRLERQFSKLGVVVAEANILNIDPNDQFKQRMVEVQKSQAQLMVARQGRQTADEQKKLVTAQGEMEVEQKRQITLRDQIEQTTNAETAKRLALIEAGREKERAQIEKETAEIQYAKAQIEAKTTKEKAEAEAYAKKAVIQANGALEQKLEAYVKTQEVWAKAYAAAKVPTMVMGGTGEGLGRQSESQNLINLLTAKTAKDLSMDLSVKQ